MVSKACVVGTAQFKLEEIARRGVDLTVVVPPSWRDDAGRTWPVERAHTEGYNLVVEPMAFNGHFHYHFYPWLAARFGQVRPELLHMDEEPYNLATLQGFWLAGNAGARALFFTWQNLRRRYPPPFSWMERYCYARAAGAIAGNAEAVDVLRAKGYGGPTWTIQQFGVDPSLFYPRPRPGDAGVRRPLTVGWFSGRLRPQKGVHLLLEAVASLRDDTRLEILGWGQEEARLRAMAEERGLGNRFQIHAGVPSEQVPEFVSRLDVVVMPSLTYPNWKEQYGRMLIEAMACAVPVVGSDSGEIPHVIGDAGLVYPEQDVAALAEHLRRLRDDPALRAELGAQGLDRVRARYTHARIAEQTVDAYQQILRGRASSSS